MTLQTSGPISLANIQTEFGGSNPISLSEYYGAASGVPTSGAISLANFYGKSSLLGLTAQSSTLVGPTTSTAVTMPAFAAGDIAVATIFVTKSWQIVGTLAIGVPSGWTSITQTSQHTTGPFTKGEYYVSTRMLICYKVLTSGDTTFTNSVTPTSGTAANYSTTVQVYRPSATISSVTVNDLTTTASNTINCSGAGASVIAFGGNHGDVTATQTWGAGPTYANAWSINQTYDYHYGRAGSYVQSTATPSDVTWSANGSIYASGYLKVT